MPQTTHLGPEPIPLIVMVIFIETGSSILLNPKIVTSFGRFRLFCLGCLLSKTYFELILKMEEVMNSSNLNVKSHSDNNREPRFKWSDSLD